MKPAPLLHCTRGVRAALLLAAALALAGCASSPAPTLLTLPSVPAAHGVEGRVGLVPSPEPGAPVLAVARLDMPEYIVSRRVRYRADSSTLAEWPNTFWAERIEIGMTREFAAALRERLPGWRICEANCHERGAVASLRVAFSRLDHLRHEGVLRASARLVLSSTGARPGEVIDQERRYQITARGDGPQAQAEAYAALLGEVAQDAAGGVGAGLPAAAPASGR